jgi:hypothetical protein
MADLYTEDATYGWNYGDRTDFMAVGRDEIRELALGEEMGGLDGWEYPYEEIVIDEQKGMVVGFWRQIADATRDDGTPYEVAGIGGSWFRYGGDFQWRGSATGSTSATPRAVHGDDDRRQAVRRHDRAHEPLDEARLPGYYPRARRR